uniref:DUF4794 domain-containing protein n=1 Tax=Anopheles merus TaxID=30066 RepID=A0A182VK56_ANOME
MKGRRFLQLLPVLALCASSYFPHSVSAQFGMGPSPLLSLEDYDSDEMIPLVRQVRVPEPSSYTRSQPNARMLPSVESFPITDDVLKQLRSLLIVTPENKITKLKLPRKSAAKTTVKHAATVTTPTVPTTSTMSTVSTTSAPRPAMTSTASAPDSREVGKKWFPLLLQEAIDNILQKDTSELDELDELVDQIASGSRVHRQEVYEEPPASYRNAYDQPSAGESDTAGSVDLPSVNLEQFRAGVPYVVNIFNNTQIGYIVMQVANDSEIRVEPPEDAPESVTVSLDVERKTRRTVPDTNEEYDYNLLPSANSLPNQMSSKSAYKESPTVQYMHKSKLPVPLPARAPAVEPPFFNLLNTPDNEPVRYRVLLRNNDAQPDKINVRLPLPGQLLSSPVKLLTGDRHPANQPHGKPPIPKRKPLYQEPTVLRSRLPAADTVVESFESRPAARRAPNGRVVRKYDYESSETELPSEDQTDFTLPATNTVTQRTAKILSSGKHSPTTTAVHRTTPEPYSEAQKYNFGRTFGSTDAQQDGDGERDQPTTARSGSSADSPSLTDLPGDDVLFNQTPENRMVRAGQDSVVDAYRRKRKEDRPLKRSIPTSDGALNELFGQGAGKGRRRWGPRLLSSEESEEDRS